MYLVLIIVITVTCVALVLRPRALRDHPFFGEGEFYVFAHRGGRGLWPEETLYAFRRAVDLGVDVLEMDINMTKDGQIVVLHGPTVDDTTDGAGPVSGLSVEEIKKLDAGYRWSNNGGKTFPFRGSGLTIPTLAEVFAAFPDVKMNIEIKTPGKTAAEALARLIRESGKTDTVLVVSEFHDTVRRFRRLCPDAATAASKWEVVVFHVLDRLHLAGLYRPSVHALQVPEKSGEIRVLTESLLHVAHKRNSRVHIWTVNDVEDMKRLIEMGVDGIMTDYPDRLLSILRR